MVVQTPFSFNIPPGIRYGAGSIESSIEELISCLGLNLMLISDPGLTDLGLYNRLLDLLTSKGISVTVFDVVESDPSLSTVLKSISSGVECSATGIIGFGGGSSMDVAKLTALILGSKENLEGAWGVNNAKGPRIPLCLIPTTAGTGSEVTPVSIITINGNEKRGVVSPIILPDLAILDPSLTVGLPANTTASTGIDAMVHAIEAFASKNINNNVISRLMATEALSLLGRSIRLVVSDGSNIDARGEMLMGSMLAGIAFANSPVAAVHALAYPIGGTFHVSHGLSNALVLPDVLRFNSSNEYAASAYAYLGKIVFPKVDMRGSDKKIAFMFSDQLQALSEDLGLPTRLRDLKIPQEACQQLAVDSMQQTRLLVNNPREMSESDALKIYETAW